MRTASICVLILAAAAPRAEAASYRVLASLPGSALPSEPNAGTVALGGLLYGTSAKGGQYNLGAVYSYDPTTNAVTTLHSFTGAADGGSPAAGLTTFGGELYGTAASGGAAGHGVIFKLDPSGTETTLYSFLGGTDGAAPAGQLLSVGNILYGTTVRGGGGGGRGTIYQFDPATGVETVDYRFAGDHTTLRGPHGRLAQAAGSLFGIACCGGVADNGGIFGFTPSTGAINVVHRFGIDKIGFAPDQDLTAVGDEIYGVTAIGGNGKTSSLFAVNATTGTIRQVHALPSNDTLQAPGSGGLTAIGGVLYGALGGGHEGGGPADIAIYSYDPSTSAFTTLQRTAFASHGYAQYIDEGLTELNGALYAPATGGGLTGSGSIYRYDLATNSIDVPGQFVGAGQILATPALAAAGGWLYGVAPAGGAQGVGQIFRLNPATGASKGIHDFAITDGLWPNGALVSVGNLLYGTTAIGGANDRGVLFAINHASGAFNVLHDFPSDFYLGTNGNLAFLDGRLYGVMNSSSGGTLFAVDARNARLATLATDCPASSVTAAAGILYVTEVEFEPPYYFCSAIEAHDPATDTNSTVIQYSTSDFAAGPTDVSGGTLYTINWSDSLTPFLSAVTASTGAIAPIYSFPSDLGIRVNGPVVMLNGVLYGTAVQYGPPPGPGFIFAVNIATGTETTLYTFTGGADGGTPLAGLTLLNGKLYGTTSVGGADQHGTAFTIEP